MRELHARVRHPVVAPMLHDALGRQQPRGLRRVAPLRLELRRLLRDPAVVLRRLLAEHGNEVRNLRAEHW